MKSIRIVRTAVHALRRNVMRAILTTLGIIIGIAAVIAMVEIGNGVSGAISSLIVSMGANSLLVLPGAAASGGVNWGAGTTMTLTPQDGQALLDDCPAIRYMAPIVRSHGQVIYGNQNWTPMQVSGTTPEFLEIHDWTEMGQGAMFTPRDVRNAAKVCVIGQTLVDHLFGKMNPIGKDIRLQNVSLTVVGVLAPKGANMMGYDQDDILLAPWTTIKYRVSNQSTATLAADSSAGTSASATSTTVNTLDDLYPTPGDPDTIYPLPSVTELADSPMPIRFANVDQLLVSADSTHDIPRAMDEIQNVLHERHRIKGDAPDDFQIRDMTEMIKTFTSGVMLMTALVFWVAVISLVVGGVGIMNIMLVSVTERTREIGLRMAVGARRTDILIQFLVEAVLLCLMGGAIGILLGRGISMLISRLLVQTQYSVAAMALAVVVSVTVGVVFGFYPAWKASRLDPIEALRYE